MTKFPQIAAYDFLQKIYGRATIPLRTFTKLTLMALKENIIDINEAKNMFLKSGNIDENDYSTAIPILIDIAGTIMIKFPLLRFIVHNLKNNPNPNYLYTFDYEGEHSRFGYGSDTDRYPFNGGIHHSNDNIYLFATHDLNEKDTLFAKSMIALWTSFVIGGKPEASTVPIWHPMTNLRGPYLHIDPGYSMGTNFADEFLGALNDNNRKK